MALTMEEIHFAKDAIEYFENTGEVPNNDWFQSYKFTQYSIGSGINGKALNLWHNNRDDFLMSLNSGSWVVATNGVGAINIYLHKYITGEVVAKWMVWKDHQDSDEEKAVMASGQDIAKKAEKTEDELNQEFSDIGDEINSINRKFYDERGF